METDFQAHEAVVAALQARGERHPVQLQIERKRIKAGLEAERIERITARYRDGGGRDKRASFVAKHLQGAGNREALVYETLRASRAPEAWPALYGVHRSLEGRVLLLLEDVPGVCRWPWRDFAATCAVLQRLAEFHAAGLVIAAGSEWDYESELHRSAVATLEMLDAMRHSREWSALAKRGVRPVARITSSLARRRAALLEFPPRGRITIHGDVHPGNVILRRGHGANTPVLIDWGRARPGSALEDVSSWLQSLGYWEPEARKRHDTLLRHYLRASGTRDYLSSDLRAAYWMAGACNALAGALRYHCWRASTATTVRARTASAHAAASWLRVVIRADALSS